MESPIAANSLVLGSLPARHARYRPHHTAVIVQGEAAGDREIRLDWREFDAYVNRYANALAGLGVARGDRVATVLANSLELLATYWACAKLGAAAVPLSPLLTASGLASLLGDAQPRVVVAAADSLAMLDEVRGTLTGEAAPHWVLTGAGADDEARGYRSFGALIAGASAAPPAAHVEAGDLLTLMYTSGTTGPAQGDPAHALHPRDVCDDARVHVADGAGVGRAALRGAGVQRRDDDDVPRVHGGRNLRAAPRVRRRSLHRHRRARARHAHDAGALAGHRDTQRARLRPGAARVAADDPVAGRAAAPRIQGPAERIACRTASTSCTG